MGSSNFFRQALDPGGVTMHALGIDKIPAVQRLTAAMPGTDWGVTKEVAPTTYNAQQAWMAKMRPPLAAGGSFANVAPTLADSLGGYGEAARGVTVGAGPTSVAPSTPPPKQIGVVPRVGAQQANPYGAGGW